MTISLKTCKNQFLALEIPESSVSLKKYPSYGQSADRYGLQVTIPYGQYTMYLQQGACGILSEIAPGSLVGSLTTHSLRLTLYLQVRSWFSWSLRRLKTGDPAFDRKFIIRSSDPSLARKTCTDPYIRHLLLTPITLFNVSQTRYESVITYKKLNLKLYTTEELKQFIAEFQSIVKKLGIP